MRKNNIDGLDANSWCWAFVCGAAFGAGRLDRSTFLKSLPIGDASPAAKKLLNALETGDSASIIQVFAGFHVTIANGADLFNKLAHHLKLSSAQEILEDRIEQALFSLRAGHPETGEVLSKLSALVEKLKEEVDGIKPTGT